ncbi:pyrroline-5-carboxylate reductase [Kordiimonas aquimaris]|uniref:pyrroline-5-carboxylate reductase n=1 Tax=Kordiimonas aquimaris TaxID=707591 RepID=UPI0021D229B1|nr:pyrroline-5-carboxylate reductase [Kordiimonas aquimaris]
MMNLSEFTPNAPLVLVGCGNMGGALARGWLASGLSADALVIVDRLFEVENLPEARGARVVDSLDALETGLLAKAVLLAVKPQIINDVMPSLSPFINNNTLIISVAAGVTLDQMARGVGADKQCARVMPNTPAAVAAGASGIACSENVSLANMALTKALMEAVGLAVVLENEQQIDAVTATSGSGPAYVFYMVEALAAAGEKLGLSQEGAEALARQTIIGAAKLLEADTGTSAATLRERVTSPKGTTEAALKVLMGEGGMTTLLERATEAAAKRSKELAG